ncbi:hypothetical protein PR048_029578 [Dryococelus australis]|uniref:Uncharacterized protein n=1 Tax=Dryococelus australis TaxID=614101 RepID=A0ABQ9GDS3_9NEOP|nr:hypothetical protein PR048_029578 [Dryococelus australis]
MPSTMFPDPHFYTTWVADSARRSHINMAVIYPEWKSVKDGSGAMSSEHHFYTTRLGSSRCATDSGMRSCVLATLPPARQVARTRHIAQRRFVVCESCRLARRLKDASSLQALFTSLIAVLLPRKASALRRRLSGNQFATQGCRQTTFSERSRHIMALTSAHFTVNSLCRHCGQDWSELPIFSTTATLVVMVSVFPLAIVLLVLAASHTPTALCNRSVRPQAASVRRQRSDEPVERRVAARAKSADCDHRYSEDIDFHSFDIFMGQTFRRGAAVVWWSDYSPVTNARGDRAGRCHWSAGFLGDLLFPQPLHSGVVTFPTRFTLVSSQNHEVKSRPKSLH